jgi:WD40 repeat protein
VSWEAKVKVWDVPGQQELMSFGGALAGFLGVAMSPDGSRVAATSSEGRVKLIDVEKKLEVGSLRGGNDLIAFLPDGNTLFAVGREGFRVWRAASFMETDAK